MYIILILIALQFLQPSPLYVVSPDFPDGGDIPVRFTCDGDDVYPTLIVNGIPEGTQSLALIVEDPDAPLETQWLVWNIKPTETITESSLREVDGIATAGSHRYRGPCPSDDSGQRYAFKVYALDAVLSIQSSAGRQAIEKEMEDHLLASGQLRGKYSRSVAIGKKRRR